MDLVVFLQNIDVELESQQRLVDRWSELNEKEVPYFAESLQWFFKSLHHSPYNVYHQLPHALRWLKIVILLDESDSDFIRKCRATVEPLARPDIPFEHLRAVVLTVIANEELARETLQSVIKD